MTGDWSLKYPAWILLVYFCVLFPFIHLVFRNVIRSPEMGYLAYCGTTLLFLLIFNKTTIEALGFVKDNFLQNNLLGGICGGAILISLPLIDGFMGLSGLGNSELFVGSEQRIGATTPEGISVTAIILSVLATPVIEQTFFSGFVLQSLLKKFKPITAIYLGALIFTLAHFNFQLSGFAIGIITASLFYSTGSLYAPILFQAACHAGGLIIEYHYPRLVTILGFLF